MHRLHGWLLCLFLCTATAQTRPLIHIQGADAQLEANIRHHLSIINEPCSASPTDLARQRSQILREMDAAARALGFYHAQLDTLSFQRKDECWSLHMALTPGPRVQVGEVDINLLGEAASDPTFEALRHNPPIRPGDPLNHSQYDRLKQQFQALALRQGYFDARFVIHELRVDVRRDRAVIRLVFDSGPRYAIGPIEIRQDILDPDFVRRYLNVQTGQPYQSRNLADLHRRFADSDLFQHVEIKTQPRRDPQPEVATVITLEPKKRHRYSFGIGFDTNTGPRLTFGYVNRYLNRRGHRVNADLRLSFVDSRLTAGYLIPWNDPLTENLRLNAGLRRQDVDTFTSNQATLNAAFTHQRGRWSETESLGLNYEKSHVEGEEEIESLMLLPGIGWTHKWLQLREGRISRGRKFDFNVRGGATLLGSSSHFLRLHMWGKYVRALPWKARLIHRWELGALTTPHFSRLPASFRFFAGGDNSIRGYSYQSLGPENNEGEVIGGRYLGIASLEYEQTLIGNWGVALFADGGNAYDQLEGLWRASRFGAGLGLRWFSPVGLLRLDVATKLTQDAPDIRIHFAIGPLL